MRKLHVEHSQPITSHARELILFCHRGSVTLSTEGISASLHARDTAVLQQSGALTLSADIASEVFLVEISTP